MKKRVFALAACLLLVMVTTTQVAIARTPQALPILSFSGTTARGSVICQADGDLERISAKLTLYEGTFIQIPGVAQERVWCLFPANALSKVVRPIDWFLPGASMALLNPQSQ